MLTLDHLAISGVTLQEAQHHIETALGVRLEPGGIHEVFGTHNALLGLADGLYLEAIAINPEAPAPARPRWFDLDRFAGAPRATNWICRTSVLDDAIARLPSGTGAPVELARGDLEWLMAVPDEGILPFDNLFPALIQWKGNAHPADRLKPSGCRLARLIIAHPEAQALSQILSGVLDDERIVFTADKDAALHIEIETPHGLRHLD